MYFGTEKSARIMVPTGVAAFNIGGASIHHELTINPDRNSNGAYMHITGDRPQQMQEDYKDTELIINDKYNMLGRTMFANVDRRCRDISLKTNLLGMCIVIVRDIRQLPTVFDDRLYAERGNLIQQSGGIAYAGFDKCGRLSQVFRHPGDAEALCRNALLRLSDGTSTSDGWQLFQSRDYSLLSLEEKNSFKDALRLFLTKQAANEYNRSRLIELGRSVTRITAKHNCDIASDASLDDAKCLKKLLCLSIGSRVVLQANLTTQYVLVNDTMGTIVDIVYASACTSQLICLLE